MKKSKKFCQKCGAEITDSNLTSCPTCNEKISKPITKKWWFWLLIAFGVIIIAAAGSEDSPNDSENDGASTTAITASTTVDTASTTKSTSQDKQYTKVDIQTMLDDLDNNALKAEATYQNMYVEITAKIANFDSDGAYISVEPVNADEWSFDMVICYIKNNSQREFLMEKSKGDTVTIKGKIISIGEVLGYSIKIDSIS